MLTIIIILAFIGGAFIVFNQEIVNFLMGRKTNKAKTVSQKNDRKPSIKRTRYGKTYSHMYHF